MRNLTEEHKRKIGKANKSILCEKVKKGIYISPMIGNHHTKEDKEKMSKMKKGISKLKIDKDKLYHLYIIEKKTAKEVSKIFNCSEGCIVNRLKLYKINQRTKRESKLGSSNPMYNKHPHNFNNYSSLEPYGPKFNNKLKETIRKFYHYRCQQCFRHQNEFATKLHIHHIDFDKKNNNILNLIPLCRGCHSQTNYGREDWTTYFKNKVLKLD